MLIIILLNLIIIFQINGFPSSKDLSLKRNKLEEEPNLFEGDMRFLVSSNSARGVLLRGDVVAWTNGIVPYEIVSSGYESTQVSFIINTMQKMERLIAINNIKCIHFRPRILSDQYYIIIQNGTGCSSSVGQETGQDKERNVILEYPRCFLEGLIMHEFLHVLGFFHEQSRPDRDNYIKINYSNIIPGMEYNFGKFDNSVVDIQNTPYDYSSLMHYEPYYFSSNGFPTIEPLQPNVKIGQRYNMSPIDIEEVRLFYNCSSNGITLPTLPTTTTANFNAVNTTISSSLTTNSEIYARYDRSNQSYYYEAYQVRVSTSGYYRFTSESSMDTYGYLFQENFDPNSSYSNLIVRDDDTGGYEQFQFQSYLQPDTKYILVITTYNPFVTGNYQLILSGLTEVNLMKLNDNSTTITSTTTPSTSTTSKKITRRSRFSSTTSKKITRTSRFPSTTSTTTSSISTQLNIGIIYCIVHILVEYLINDSMLT